MSDLTPSQLASLAHDQAVWLSGLRAGRDSIWSMESTTEAEAQSPYLVEGRDPFDLLPVGLRS